MTDPNTIEIDTFCLGPYQTNCYIVRSQTPDGARACWVADVSFEAGSLMARLDELGLTPEAFVLTHAHVDHIAGLFDAKERHPETPIWIHEAEESWLLDADRNLSALSPMPMTAPPADRLFVDGEDLELCGQAWRVLHTPGHSPGGVSFYHEASRTCICGDAIFAGSIGRTDFPGSDFETLAASIREKLYTLPDETRLLPGHGPATTVGVEKVGNPFVRA